MKFTSLFESRLNFTRSPNWKQMFKLFKKVKTLNATAFDHFTSNIHMDLLQGEPSLQNLSGLSVVPHLPHPLL